MKKFKIKYSLNGTALSTRIIDALSPEHATRQLRQLHAGVQCIVKTVKHIKDEENEI